MMNFSSFQLLKSEFVFKHVMEYQDGPLLVVLWSSRKLAAILNKITIAKMRQILVSTLTRERNAMPKSQIFNGKIHGIIKK